MDTYLTLLEVKSLALNIHQPPYPFNSPSFYQFLKPDTNTLL